MKMFVSARKIGNQHFKLLFFTINLHFVLSNQIPTYRKPSDSNGIRTHNHLVRKRILNHLGKLAYSLSD